MQKLILALLALASYHNVFGACPDKVSHTREGAVAVQCFNEAFEVLHGQDDDWFTVNLTKDIPVVFQVSAKLNSDSLTFYAYGDKIADDSDAFSVKRTEIGNGDNALITFTPAYSGKYLINIKGDKARGSYNFAVHQTWLTPKVSDKARALNATFYTAKTLATGTYNLEDSPIKENYYRFRAKAGQKVSIELKQTRGEDLIANVFNTKSVKIFKNKTLSKESDSTVLSFTSYHDDVYFLSITGSDATFEVKQLKAHTADTDTDKDGLSDYQELLIGTSLSKKDTDGDGKSDAEEYSKGQNPRTKISLSIGKNLEGETKALAQPLTHRNVPYEITTLKEQGKHWLKLQLRKDHPVTLLIKSRVNGVQGSNSSGLIRANVYGNKDDYRLAYANINDQQTDWITISPEYSGEYYIRLQSDNNYSNRSSLGYAEVTVYDAWWEKTAVKNDYNYTITNAQQITNEFQYLPQGSSNHARYYRMLVKRGETVTFSIEALRDGRRSNSLSVYLYDSNLTDIGSFYAYFYVGNAAKSIEKEIKVTGVYYLKVSGDATFRMKVTGVEDYNLDTDKDKLTDIAEYAIGTKVDNTDTDNDKVNDYDDFYPLNPDQSTPFKVGKIYWDGFE